MRPGIRTGDYDPCLWASRYGHPYAGLAVIVLVLWILTAITRVRSNLFSDAPGILLIATFLCACGGGDRRTTERRTDKPSGAAVAATGHVAQSCRNDPDIGRVGFAGTPPVLAKRVEPAVDSVPAGVHGIVILELIVDREGIPCSVKVVRSVGAAADAAAIAAVKQWRFSPAKLDGKPWPVAITVTVAVEH